MRSIARNYEAVSDPSHVGPVQSQGLSTGMVRQTKSSGGEPYHAVAPTRFMNKRLIITCIATVSVAIFIAIPADADSVNLSTGNPDELMAVATRPSTAGKFEPKRAMISC